MKIVVKYNGNSPKDKKEFDSLMENQAFFRRQQNGFGFKSTSDSYEIPTTRTELFNSLVEMFYREGILLEDIDVTAEEKSAKKVNIAIKLLNRVTGDTAASRDGYQKKVNDTFVTLKQQFLDTKREESNTPEQIDQDYVPFETMNELWDCIGNSACNKDDDLKQRSNAIENKFKYEKLVTGKRQTLIEKKFNSHSYNGPTRHDFEERLEIIFESAEKMIERKFQDPNIQEKKAQLLSLKQNALKLLENCKIDPVAVDQLLEHEDSTVDKIKRAKTIIGAFIHDAVPLLQNNNEKSKDIIDALAVEESKLTAKKGRPNFINFYTVPQNSVDPVDPRYSIQRVVEDAIPSTVRDKPKLANFVECSVGYLEGDSRVPQFSGYRHSSYSATQIPDKFKRRQAESRIVKDMIVELALKQLKKGGDVVNEPIQLNLSSLSLLSPIASDKLILGADSEYRQLKDSYHALMMYDGRTIEVDIPGFGLKKVQPNIQILNAVSNPLGFSAHSSIVGQISGQLEIENQINAQGINQFILDSFKYLNGVDVEKAKDLYTKMTNDKIAFDIEHLNDLREKMISLYNEINDAIDNGDASKYQAAFDKIKQSEQSLFKAEKELNAKFNSILTLERLQNHLDEFTEQKTRLTNQLQNASGDEKPALQKKLDDLEVAELVYQTIAMQRNRALEPAHYGSRYLLANQKMGRDVDFYCKSGEDRTGRMENFIEELCEFHRQYGYYPRYDFKTKEINADDKEKQQNIAAYVSEFSVSRDINDQNAHGARGLQITSGMKINSGLPNASGNHIGKLAKGVYEASKSSVSLEQLMDRTITVIEEEVVGNESNITEVSSSLKETPVTSYEITADEANIAPMVTGELGLVQPDLVLSEVGSEKQSEEEMDKIKEKKSLKINDELPQSPPKPPKPPPIKHETAVASDETTVDKDNIAFQVGQDEVKPDSVPEDSPILELKRSTNNITDQTLKGMSSYKFGYGDNQKKLKEQIRKIQDTMNDLNGSDPLVTQV